MNIKNGLLAYNNGYYFYEYTYDKSAFLEFDLNLRVYFPVLITAKFTKETAFTDIFVET